eukprot:g3958.t1
MALPGLPLPPVGEEEADMPDILCCMCSVTIKPNASNMCVQCLRTQVDLTEVVSTDVTVYQCSRCLRWLSDSWTTCELESRELLALCLKKIQGLKKVKLVDASWVWTEPHSKRLKIKLTVQKEVLNGAILQQSFIVECVVANQQCDVCAGSFTNMAWKAVVQVRQKVDHKRTFFYLEQLILRSRAHEHCSQIETLPDGMDFYFTERNKAMRFLDFLDSVIPVRSRASKKLVSTDTHSNNTNFKFTFMVEIAKPCKDDVIVIPLKLANNLGTIPRLQLVQRVCSSIHLVDPCTLQTAEIGSDKFWHHHAKIETLLSSKQLQEFIVLDSEILVPEHVKGRRILQAHARGRLRGKARHQQLAEVEVAKASDLGHNDTRLTAVSHLGHLLRAGDSVLGYHLSAGSFREEATAGLPEMPDVWLVRKQFVKRQGSRRAWRLRSLETREAAMEEEDTFGAKNKGGGAAARRQQRSAEDDEADYEQFLSHLASDRELRRGVNLYRADAPQPMAATGAGAATGDAAAEGEVEEEEDDEDDYDPEAVELNELLDDMVIEDPDAPPDAATDASVAAAAAAGAAGGGGTGSGSGSI